jgi:outer membrane lipoprotein-sorting protein
LDRENIDKLGIVGNKLGEFKIEYENISRAIIISAKKFLWLYKNGEQRCIWRCKRKDDPEYNFRVFEKMIQE